MSIVQVLKTDTSDLTKGPLGKQLAALTIPMMFGTLGTMMFNLVDTFYIGQLGTDQLAAISFTFPVVMVIMSISIGLGISATSLISRAIGESDRAKVKNLTSQSLLLSIAIVAIISTVGIFTIDPVFTLLGADSKMLPMIRDYMMIWYPGMVVLVIPMIGNSAIRSTGNTKFPSAVMLVSMVVNVILDPIFIFGLFGFPRLELKGAAIATVIARSITLIFSLWLLGKKLEMITVSFPKFSEIWRNWKKLLYIGIPISATNVITPVSIGFVTALLARENTEAVAAFGVASRLEGFLLVAIMALGMSLGPVVGQNWGAKNYTRAWLASKHSAKFSVVWGIFIWLIMLLAAEPAASLFDDHEAVIAITGLYFLTVSWTYGFRGILRLTTSVLGIINRPIDSAALNLIQSFVLLVPLSYAGRALFGIEGIFGALAISVLISGSGALYHTRSVIRKAILSQSFS